MQYAHGGDIYTYKNLLDFSINVNPLGPADAVVEAAARSLQRIGEYPDSQSRELRNALAEKKGLAAEQFVIGNGAADLLFSLVLAEKPQKAMIVIPAFSEYEQALKTVGCEILYHEVKKENNFRLGTDLTEKITSELDFLFLCSPSNPAGQAVDFRGRGIHAVGDRQVQVSVRIAGFYKNLCSSGNPSWVRDQF